MSAFMVSNTHIDALLSGALSTDGGRFTWYRWDEAGEPQQQTVDYSTADQVGAMLLAENRASVDYRYQESDLEPIYEFRLLSGWPIPLVVLRAIACYEYQSSEHPGWRSSNAAAFCDRLRQEMIALLPGYRDLPGEINDRHVFGTATRIV